MFRYSIPALILSNLIPVFGVLFLDWSAAAILILYWAENIVVGFFNVLKMIMAKGPKRISPRRDIPGSVVRTSEKVFGIGFFIVHFGAFTLGHGVFVVSLFGKDFPSPGSFAIAVASLFLSHGLSFALHYVKKGEYKEAQFNQLFFSPYKRIIVMHITIIAAGWALGMLGSPDGALLVLIALKIFFDTQAHRKEHTMKSAAKPSA